MACSAAEQTDLRKDIYVLSNTTIGSKKLSYAFLENHVKSLSVPGHMDKHTRA